MAKVLFVEKQLRNEKLGLMHLAAVLKKGGHEVELICTEEEDIESVMVLFDPDFVAFSVMTGGHQYAAELNRTLKAQYDYISVFGGPHCTFFPEIVDEDGVDFVIQGAGEERILEVVEGRLAPGLYKGNIPENMDALPFPDRNIIYKYGRFADNPIKNIMTIRDCPYNCSYCYNHLWKSFYADQQSRLFQRRSVDSVIDEIHAIQANYPLQKINFLDDNFIQKREWIKEFCLSYKEKVHLPFLINVRVNLLDEQLVADLKDAGLEMVNFALESANPVVQRDVLNRGNFSNESVSKSIDLFRKFNIRVRMQNMIGLPVQDPLADALATLKFNLENRVDDAWVSIFQPYPRTQLAAYCEQNGFITGASIENCADSFFDESRLDIPDKDKLYRLQKWWYHIVRYSLPAEFIDLLLDFPISRDQGDILLSERFRMSKKYFYGLET